MKDPRELPSQLLVGLQFSLLFFLTWLSREPLLALALPVVSWASLLFASLLALWAFSANRFGNFNIRPIPKAGGMLVTHGPYRWIRHPMYSAFLLGAFALARCADQAQGWLAWAVLLGVLWIKSDLEERWMQEAHPGYAAYQGRTRRFIPGLV